jgi:hypothetical protein
MKTNSPPSSRQRAVCAWQFGSPNLRCGSDEKLRVLSTTSLCRRERAGSRAAARTGAEVSTGNELRRIAAAHAMLSGPS